jgi:hypothetical protein
MFFRKEFRNHLADDALLVEAENFRIFPVDDQVAPVFILEIDEGRQVVDEGPELLFGLAAGLWRFS